jgi:hypothetical protein
MFGLPLFTRCGISTPADVALGLTPPTPVAPAPVSLPLDLDGIPISFDIRFIYADRPGVWVVGAAGS